MVRALGRRALDVAEGLFLIFESNYFFTKMNLSEFSKSYLDFAKIESFDFV